jgi:hypothetical protein
MEAKTALLDGGVGLAYENKVVGVLPPFVVNGGGDDNGLVGGGQIEFVFIGGRGGGGGVADPAGQRSAGMAETRCCGELGIIIGRRNNVRSTRCRRWRRWLHQCGDGRKYM